MQICTARITDEIKFQRKLRLPLQHFYKRALGFLAYSVGEQPQIFLKYLEK